MKTRPFLFIDLIEFLLVLVISALAGGCSKKDSALLIPTALKTDSTTFSTPAVTIDSISSLSPTSATIYGSAKSRNGITDRGVYWGLYAHPTGNKTAASSYSSGSPGFTVNLIGLQPNTFYWVRSYGINSEGVAYSNDRQFTTLPAPNHISVLTDTVFASGAFTAFAAGYVKDSVGTGIKESGICIAKTANPKVTDRKIISPGVNDLNIFVRIDSLKEASSYNIRAYYIDKAGQIKYGRNAVISTIPLGKVTFTFVNQDPNADAATKAAYKRIISVMTTAVAYQNGFTSCTKALSVNYSPGTPSADGNISGWIDVGANTDYQDVGTMLHEIQHTLGGGTSWFWPQLMVNGVCLGKYATQMLRFMTRNPNAVLYGDNMHSWPYGFNGYWEDTGKEMDYIIHCLILQCMKRDGLPDSQ